jgi:hypothetical protein
MKAKMFFVAAAVAMISLSSCKKDYECECEYSMGGVTASQTYTFNDVKKDDAEASCDNAGQTGWSCTLSEK